MLDKILELGNIFKTCSIYEIKPNIIEKNYPRFEDYIIRAENKVAIECSCPQFIIKKKCKHLDIYDKTYEGKGMPKMQVFLDLSIIKTVLNHNFPEIPIEVMADTVKRVRVMPTYGRELNIVINREMNKGNCYYYL